jgi:enoyl-CoA hydratase
MSEPVIIVEKRNEIAIVTLNRPEAMNALSNELREAVFNVFAGLKNDPEIGVAILTGAGRAFCAGLDLKELSSGGGLIEEILQGRYEKVNITRPLKEFGRPIIGAINGVAITGGFELALGCDILIASSNACFADTHARVGILPGAELSQKLSRLIGIYRAKEVSLTGNFISAQQAEHWGIVNRVVKPEELLPTCIDLAKDILSCPRDVIVSYKRLIDDGFFTTLQQGIELEQKVNHEYFLTVKANEIAKKKDGIQKRGKKQVNYT